MISLLLSAVAGAIQSAPVANVPIVTAPIVTTPIVTAPIVMAPAPTTALAQIVHPAVPAKAIGSLPQLFSSEDYPQAALIAQEQGVAQFAVTIGRDGRVTECRITASSRSATLDATTCSIIQRRARFTPARDAKGAVVEDVTTGRIRWVLPPRPPVAFADRHDRLVLTLDANGRPGDCRGERSDNDVPPPAAVCDHGKAVAGMIGANFGKTISFGNRELALESGVRVGGSDRLLNIGRGAGETLVTLVAVAVDIDATGAVVRCDSADGIPSVRDIGGACARAESMKFLPAATKDMRHAVLYQASFTRTIR